MFLLEVIGTICRLELAESGESCNEKKDM